MRAVGFNVGRVISLVLVVFLFSWVGGEDKGFVDGLRAVGSAFAVPFVGGVVALSGLIVEGEDDGFNLMASGLKLPNSLEPSFGSDFALESVAVSSRA